MRSRAAAAMGTIALLLSACGGAGSATPAPSLGVYDQSFVDGLVAQGWAEPAAIILAMTKVTVVSADDHSAHVVEAFPTGDTADIAVSVTPGGSGDPGVLRVTHAVTADGFTVTLAYHVPRVAERAEPDPDAVQGALAASLARFAAPPAAVPAPAADGSGGDVVVSAGFRKGAEAVFDSYIEHMQTFLKSEGKLDPLVQSIKSVGSVFEALDLSAKYKKLSARIDAAEECAKNPTLDLTIKAYQSDPGLRDRLLQQVDATRLDLKSNVAATYVAMLNEGLADLSKQAWLGIVVGAGDAWSAKTLDDLNERSVSDLEASITTCEKKESPSPTSDGSPTADPGESAQATAGDRPAISPGESVAPGVVMLAGTLHGTLSKDNYRGSGSADVTVKGPFGLDHFLGQDGGALSWSGAWTGNPGVPGGGCTGAGSFKATAMSIFGDNGGNGLTPADAGPIYYPELKISDGPVGEVGGPVEHGQELIVEIYASELVDATCDVTYPPGQTLEITTQTCAGGLILQLAGPGRFTGSCHSEDGSGIIDWTGEIHQVSP